MGQRTLADRMTVLDPPAFWPTLRASLSLFRHARPGLRDPTALPVIERAASGVTLDAAWLARYGASVGAVADGTLPPLALQMAAAPLHLAMLADARFPFKALGLVHLSQQVNQTRAIRTDEPLNLRAFTCDARGEKRGMSFCIRTEASSDGEVVWQGSTRALASDPALAAKSRKRSVAEPHIADAAPPSPISETLLQVPEDMGRRYAAIAGDLNPIHQRAVLARMFGFRRAIVHGTWTLARALSLSGLPGSPVFTLDAAFRRPVELPSDVMVRVWKCNGDTTQRVEVVRAGDGSLCLGVDLRMGPPH